MASTACAEAARLSPPLSLTALGLTEDATLDQALEALISAQRELDSKSVPDGDEGLRRRASAANAEVSEAEAAASALPTLPPREELQVLLLPAGGGEAVPLVRTGGSGRLKDLGVETQSEGAPPRLCLAQHSAGQGTKQTWLPQLLRLRCRGCCRRNGPVRKAARRCGARVWTALPAKWQDRLKPYGQQLAFFWMCARFAITWLWEDRWSIFYEVKGMVVDDSPAPLSAAKMREELSPFVYAFCLGLCYAALDVFWQILHSPAVPMDLALD